MPQCFYFKFFQGKLLCLLGRKNIILLSGLFAVIYLFLMLHISNLIMAFSAFIIFCFALALISGVDRALLYDDLHYQNKQQHYHKIFGLYNALSIGALAFSSFIGGWIADQQYWFFI